MMPFVCLLAIWIFFLRKWSSCQAFCPTVGLSVLFLSNSAVLWHAGYEFFVRCMECKHQCPVFPLSLDERERSALMIQFPNAFLYGRCSVSCVTHLWLLLRLKLFCRSSVVFLCRSEDSMHWRCSLRSVGRETTGLQLVSCCGTLLWVRGPWGVAVPGFFSAAL